MPKHMGEIRQDIMNNRENSRGISKEKMFQNYIKKDKFIGNRFRIVRTLGEGGMGTVHLAENVNLGTLWAIKEISKKGDKDRALSTEANILKRLNHPALPRIIDTIEDENNLYIVQDFIEGVSLDKHIKEFGKLSGEKVIEWGKQICDVLIYLHSFKPNPIIYRDMKPANIILTPQNEIKLVDFGIAREYKETSKDDTVYIGTRGYAPPEQYGRGQSNVTTDIYSFGITLFHLLTGEGPDLFPFGLRPPEYCSNSTFHSNDGKYQGIMQIISKCTRFSPEERYQSVSQLKEDLEGLKGGRGDLDKAENTPVNKLFYNKNLTLTIWGNAEFACELAYTISKTTKLNVMLADLDLLSPSVDLFLNVKKYTPNIIREKVLNESGINIILDSIERDSLTKEELIRASVKRKELKNLYILTGNYRLENYEYYNNDSTIKFIETSGQIFDVLILTVNKFIYDSFTVLCLLKSDFNIIPISANIKELREFNSYILFLKEKQGIPINKNKFVAFNYHPPRNLDKNTIREITQGNYLGKIGYCQRREKYRNLRLPYAKKMDPKVIKDYRDIFQNLVELHSKPLEKNKKSRGWEFAYN